MVSSRISGQDMRNNREKTDQDTTNDDRDRQIQDGCYDGNYERKPHEGGKKAKQTKWIQRLRQSLVTMLEELH